MDNPKTLIILGRSGSGKGTQIELLAEKINPTLVIHTGHLFRNLSNQPTFIGKKAKETQQAGGLQPMWLASFLWMRELLEKFTGEEHLIFDGSPRKEKEAEEIDKVLEWLGRGAAQAVLIDVPEDEAVYRLLKRGRDDDVADAIKERMEWYNTEVQPVVDHYKKAGKLVVIDGMGTVEEIFKKITEALQI